MDSRKGQKAGLSQRRKGKQLRKAMNGLLFLSALPVGYRVLFILLLIFGMSPCFPLRLCAFARDQPFAFSVFARRISRRSFA
jgi:hypothetical protein